MTDERKPLPCGLLLVNGGTVPHYTLKLLVEFMRKLYNGEEPGICVIHGQPFQGSDGVSFEYVSFITGERVELQRDDFAEAVKRGSIKYTVKGEEDEQG